MLRCDVILFDFLWLFHRVLGQERCDSIRKKPGKVARSMSGLGPDGVMGRWQWVWAFIPHLIPRGAPPPPIMLPAQPETLPPGPPNDGLMSMHAPNVPAPVPQPGMPSMVPMPPVVPPPHLAQPAPPPPPVPGTEEAASPDENKSHVKPPQSLPTKAKSSPWGKGKGKGKAKGKDEDTVEIEESEPEEEFQAEEEPEPAPKKRKGYWKFEANVDEESEVYESYVKKRTRELRDPWDDESQYDDYYWDEERGRWKPYYPEGGSFTSSHRGPRRTKWSVLLIRCEVFEVHWLLHTSKNNMLQQLQNKD